MIFDVREDESQAIKMQEITDLLVAAGYFRARIKGLNNFDKIVGGMSWAIEMSNVDLDIDILFQESLTIGQKIALTEKIVRVLQIMKCPHKIEPHQIQGMDCIHIFPVIQWLVKKSIETRQQMGDYIKKYANWQFNRAHNLDGEKVTIKKVDEVSERQPRRKYRHPTRRRGEETDNWSSTSNIPLHDESDNQEFVSTEADETQKLAMTENSAESEETILRKKLDKAKEELAQLALDEPELLNKIDSLKERIEIVRDKQKAYQSIDTQKDDEAEDKKRLTEVLDTLKKQKSEFKQYCRDEKARIEKQIEELTNQTDTDDETEVDNEVQVNVERHTKLKKQLAELNKESAKLSRKFDDIPTRAELTQYQKRFIELYNQVAAKHNETKKFYTLYNTLDDERMYLEKELNLLNSILENFNQAQSSSSSREQFLIQFEQIVENIKQTKIKVETKRQTEKMKRDQLNEQYLELIEKQRLYYKAVKDFKEECRKNELLIAKLEEKNHNISNKVNKDNQLDND